MDEISDEPFVLFEEGAGSRSIVEERLGRRFSELDVQLSLNSNDALVAAVERGLGLTFLPERSAVLWQRLRSVRAIAIEDVDLTRDLALVLRTGVTHSAATLAFLEYIKAIETSPVVR